MSSIALRKLANAIIAVWLVVVLLAYFKVIELPEILGYLAAATIVVIVANMVWTYLIRPVVRGVGAK